MLRFRQSQNEVQIPTGSTRADRLFEAGRLETLQQGSCTRQEGYALLLGSGAVEDFLALAQFLHLCGRELLTEELRNNLGITESEGGGKIGTCERLAELTGQLQPRLEVQLGCID